MSEIFVYGILTMGEMEDYDVPSNPQRMPTIDNVRDTRLNRRGAFAGLVAIGGRLCGALLSLGAAGAVR